MDGRIEASAGNAPNIQDRHAALATSLQRQLILYVYRNVAAARTGKKYSMIYYR